MKSIPVLVIVLVLTCCNDADKNATGTTTASTTGTARGGNTNQPAAGGDGLPVNTTSPGSNTGTKTTTNDEPIKASSVNPDADAIVFVGVFARWNFPGGEQFDGSYDSTNSLFVLCSNNRCQKVPRSQISFQQFGSCDTAVRNRIKLFKKIDSNRFNQVGKDIKITGDKGIIYLGPATRVIQFDAPTMNRIKKVYLTKPAGILKTPGSAAVKEVVSTKPVMVRDVIMQDTVSKPGIRKAAMTTKPAAMRMVRQR